MSCTTEEIHVGDIGTVFEVTAAECVDGVSESINLATATAQHIVFQKPSGEVITRDTTFVTDGTDGVVSYVTVADDLDEPKNWKYQFYVAMPSGEWHSDIHKFKVYSNL